MSSGEGRRVVVSGMEGGTCEVWGGLDVEMCYFLSSWDIVNCSCWIWSRHVQLHFVFKRWMRILEIRRNREGTDDEDEQRYNLSFGFWVLRGEKWKSRDKGDILISGFSWTYKSLRHVACSRLDFLSQKDSTTITKWVYVLKPGVVRVLTLNRIPTEDVQWETQIGVPGEGLVRCGIFPNVLVAFAKFVL